MATIVGDDNANLLQGGSGNDSITGLGGNDELIGYGGNDTLDGGTGDDVLRGRDGSDSLLGGDGNDTLWAEGGGLSDGFGDRNHLNGGAGNDILYSGNGRDTLVGGTGDDLLSNSQGTPSYEFARGLELLQGGAGNDTLSSLSSSRMEGGIGNDLLTFQGATAMGGMFELVGGPGIDTINLVGQTDVLFVARVLDFQAGAGGDVIDMTSWKSFTGMQGTDDPFDPSLGYLRLVQAGTGTVLQFDRDGAAGSAYGWRTLLRLEGVNAAALTLADNFTNIGNIQSLAIVNGTDTAPTVLAPIADQKAIAGKFIDLSLPVTQVFRDADPGDRMVVNFTLEDGSPLPDGVAFSVTQDGNALIAQLFGQIPAGTPFGVLSIRMTVTDTAGRSASDVFVIGPASSGNDSLLGTAGDDRYDGLAGNDTIDGAGGNDSLVGNAGADSLLGNSGDDTLLGGTGSDRLDGGTGVDSMVGGSGNDTYVVDAAGDVVSETGTLATEIDTVLSSVSRTLGANLERLTLTGSAATNGAGNALANTVTGNNAANRLSGLGGNDTLSGGIGNDTLDGGSGNDVLRGQDGNDQLIGGVGNDTLTGSTGRDLFVFTSKVGTDRVTDFSAVDDTLRISMAGIKVGDGDLLVEGGAVDATPGFAKAAELVLFTTNIVGSIDAAKAAATIGSASSAFAAGDTRLFVVDNGTQSALYLFTASGADATVSAAELTQLALVSGTTTTLADYVFVA